MAASNVYDNYLMPPTHQVDVVLLYDRNTTDERFAKNLSKLMKLVRVQVNGDGGRTRPALADCFHLDFGGYGSELNTLYEAMSRSTYIFLLLTKSLSEDMRFDNPEIFFHSDEILMQSYKDKHKKDCIIPVFTMTRKEATECGFKIPAGLTHVRGIQIHELIDGKSIDTIVPEDVKFEDLNPEIVKVIQGLLSRKGSHLEERQTRETDGHRIQLVQRTESCRSDESHPQSPQQETLPVGFTSDMDLPLGRSAQESPPPASFTADMDLPLGRSAQGTPACQEEGEETLVMKTNLTHS